MRRWNDAAKESVAEALGPDAQTAKRIHEIVLRNLSARDKGRDGPGEAAPSENAAKANAAKANEAKGKSAAEGKAKAADNAERVKAAASLHDWQSNQNTVHGAGKGAAQAGKGAPAKGSGKAPAKGSGGAAKGGTAKLPEANVEVIESEIEVSEPEAAPVVTDRVVEAAAPKDDPPVAAGESEESLISRLMRISEGIQRVSAGMQVIMNPMSIPVSAILRMPDSALRDWITGTTGPDSPAKE